MAHLPFSVTESEPNDVADERSRAQKQSPGRAVRGKLVNMVLYCTHDICFSVFFCSFFFFWCEQRKKKALHVLSLSRYQNKVTQNKIKAILHMKPYDSTIKKTRRQILVHHYMDEDLTAYNILV